jgi:hypothetical protein
LQKQLRYVIFALAKQMVVLAQLVRALDCGSRGRRFEPGIPPLFQTLQETEGFFCLYHFYNAWFFEIGNVTDNLEICCRNYHYVHLP